MLAARGTQLGCARAGITSQRTNGELSLVELEQITKLEKKSRQLLENAASQLALSARAFVKVLRVARTIADLEGEENVAPTHIGEAIQGRFVLDRRT